MNIPKREHPDPVKAWDALLDFITKSGCMPDGSPLSENIVKVIALGAWVGCRLALINDGFALAIAQYGNVQPDRVYTSIDNGFKMAYAHWLSDQMANLTRIFVVMTATLSLNSSVLGVLSSFVSSKRRDIRVQIQPDHTSGSNQQHTTNTETASGTPRDAHSLTSRSHLATDGDLGEVQR